MCCCQFPGMEIKDPTDSRVKNEFIILGGHSGLFSHSDALPVPGPFIKSLPTPHPPPCKSNNGTVLPEERLPHMPAWPDPKLSHPFFFCSHSDILRTENSPQGKLSPGTNYTEHLTRGSGYLGTHRKKGWRGNTAHPQESRTGLSLWPDTECLWTHGKQA